MTADNKTDFLEDMFDQPLHDMAHDVLAQCKIKLQLYREHSNGEYHGGMEYTHLIKAIDRALRLLK